VKATEHLGQGNQAEGKKQEKTGMDCELKGASRAGGKGTNFIHWFPPLGMGA